MIDFEKCKKPDGSLDVPLFNELRCQERRDRKAKGELCQRDDCDRFIVWSKGYPQTCSDCQNLDKPAELHHPSNIRCPKCGHHWRAGDDDEYELYHEGTHQATCGECEHEFEVTTWVSYTFVSPPRAAEGSEEKE